MKKLRICLISEEFPPETGWGGIGTHVYNLSMALSEIGHEVHVVSKSVDGTEHVSGQGDLVIHRVCESEGYTKAVKSLSQAVPGAQGKEFLSVFGEFPLRSLRRGRAISQWFKRQPPFDIIEAPDYGAETFWCQFVDKIQVPVVIKLHTPLFMTQRLNTAPKEDLAVKLRKWMEKYCITHSTKVISPTRSLADIISKEFRLKGIEMLPNCIDTDFFTFKEKGGGKAWKTCIYAGRLERRKGVEVLAKAIPFVVKAFPGVKFLFVGRDTPTAEGGKSMRKWLEDFFAEQRVGQYVSFVGEVRRTEIGDYYRQADLCILPSLWENLPYTCLEAMSCGTPVVGSRIGGFPEIITEGSDGFLCEPADHVDLAARIIHVLKNEDIAELGKKARERVEKAYGHKIIAERTVELYRTTVEGNRNK